MRRELEQKEASRNSRKGELLIGDSDGKALRLSVM